MLAKRADDILALENMLDKEHEAMMVQKAVVDAAKENLKAEEAKLDQMGISAAILNGDVCHERAMYVHECSAEGRAEFLAKYKANRMT